MASVVRPALGVNTVRSVAPKRAPVRSVRTFAVVAEKRLGVMGHWLPGTEPPEYLDGAMAGDYGFDPLRLGANAETLPYLQEAELMNGRWAMAATAGILFTDAVGLPKFWEAGSVDYGLDFKTLAAVQLVTMGFLEAARIRGFMATGQSGALQNFPFDPAKLDSPATKVKEVKNARLAMMAFLGMVSQYAVTGTSPLEGLKAHMANPTAVNIFTSAVGNEFTCFVIFCSIAPCALLFEKTVRDPDYVDEFRPIPW